MFWTLLLIGIAFFLALGLRKFFPKLCAICLSVSLVWLYGIVFGGFEPLILALLMGGTAVGLMYYLSERLPERFEVFKLPFLLTAFVAFYFLLSMRVEWGSMAILAVLWIFFGLLFIARDTVAKNWFKKVVECCKNW